MKKQKNPRFVDKCTARLQFERQSVHLYETLLQKCPDALRSRFEKILKEEREHVAMLSEVLEQLGANPYELTPSAKVTRIESRGIMKAVQKSAFDDLLDSVLAAELVDTANWEMLVLMARRLGEREIARRFEKAMNEESRHLRFIHRYMLKELTGSTRLVHRAKKAA